MARSAVILSGGLDSTTLLYETVASGHDVVAAVSFNYGQRHKKELEFAKRHASVVGAEHIVIDLYAAGVTDAIKDSGSSLVADVDVPEGHYAEDNMKSTVVPNRNMMMISIAASIGIAKNVDFVATGVHAGDHFVYPDCRPRFINAANAAVVIGNEGFGPIGSQPEEAYPQVYIEAPYMNVSKNEIALRALALDVPLHLTWSCYKGGNIHCGRCGTCVERLEAINWAIAEQATKNNKLYQDNTQYADENYWREVLAQ